MNRPKFALVAPFFKEALWCEKGEGLGVRTRMGDDAYDLPMSQIAHEAFVANKTSLRELPMKNHNGSPGRPQPDSLTIDPRDALVASTRSGMAKHGKLINDPIHGAYRLDPACTLIFDTPQFQRLRRLKQLGMTYYVFPGASHNRFEHSLGVAHLAYRFANQLWTSQRNELDVERWDLRVVELAGLCHDLGHGPFSHVFEREFLRRRGICGWEHEEMSGKILNHIIDANAIDALSSDVVNRITSLITASNSSIGASSQQSKSQSKSQWLSEVVANWRNSIDVDKFDYLARDSYYCGVRVACDFNRIMQFSRVIGDEICYKWTEYMNLLELFHARASMHRNVYTHKKAKAIEFMVVDALLEAEPALRLTEKIHNPEDFVRLDDGVLDFIENLDTNNNDGIFTIDEGVHSAIRSSQKIIDRLRRRKLYKFVTDAPIPDDSGSLANWKPPSPEDVVAGYRGRNSPGIKLRPEDIIVQENKINYSMRNLNPLDNVHFYDYIGSTEKRTLKPDQISSMVASSFEEKRLRVYSRDPDPRYIAAVHEAFESWVKHRFGGAVTTSTPAKSRLHANLAVDGDGNGLLVSRKRQKQLLYHFDSY